MCFGSCRLPPSTGERRAQAPSCPSTGTARLCFTVAMTTRVLRAD